MVNKSFLSLVSALLFLTMLVQFFGVSTKGQYQAKPLSSTSLTKTPLAQDLLWTSKTSPAVNISNAEKPRQVTVNLSQKSPRIGNLNQFPDVVSHSNHEHQPVPYVFGRVTDLNNIPIQGVSVKEGGKAAGGYTNEMGLYRLALNTAKKNYWTVVFRRSGYAEKVIHVPKPAEEESNPDGLVKMDTVLEYSTRTVTVNGWIGESNGLNIEGEVIRLSSLQENLYYSTSSDEQGNFSFEGIRQDVKYQLKIKPSEKFRAIALNSLYVSSNTAPILINLDPVDLTDVTGVVVDSYGDSVANFKFNIRSEVNSVYEKAVTTDDFGRFELAQFPLGEILITTQSPEYFKVSGMRLSPSSYTNLIVPVDMGDHSLSGWVKDKNGRPIADARAVVDTESNYNEFVSSSVRTAMTDESGYFEFTNLGSGEHYITIYAKGFINEGVSYNTRARIDQLYFQLSQWSGSLISSETLKMSLNQTQ